MGIYTHERVRAAHRRAMALGSAHEEAITVVAASLDIAEETVREVVGGAPAQLADCPAAAGFFHGTGRFKAETKGQAS